MRVLLLDDDLGLLSAVESMLTELGHESESSSSPEEAVKLIESGTFDFALVDYKMPDKTGIWFMQTANIPKKTRVLLMTAFVNRDVINEMFRLGIRGYLIKPFDRAELKKHIDFYDHTMTPETVSLA